MTLEILEESAVGGGVVADCLPALSELDPTLDNSTPPICSRTIYRTKIPNLGFQTLLIEIKIQDQASKLMSCRKSCCQIL